MDSPGLGGAQFSDEIMLRDVIDVLRNERRARVSTWRQWWMRASADAIDELVKPRMLSS